MSNPYDLVAASYAEERNKQNSAALTLTSTKPPEQSAEIFDLSKKSKLPVGAVEQDPASVRLQLERERLNALSSESPMVRKWISDTQNYDLAKDDIDALSVVERGFKAIMPMTSGLVDAKKVFGPAIEQFKPSTQKLIADVMVAGSDMQSQFQDSIGLDFAEAGNPLREALGLKKNKLASEVSKQYMAESAKYGAESEQLASQYDDGSAKYYLSQFGRSVPVMVATVAGGMVNPGIGAGILFGSVGSSGYTDARADGASKEDAAIVGIGSGAIESITELPILKALKLGAKPAFKGVSKVLDKLLDTKAGRVAAVGGAEAVSELIANPSQMALEEAVLGKDYTLGDYARAARDSVVLGYAMGAPIAGLSPAPSQSPESFIRKAMDVHEAKTEKGFLDTIMNAVENTKLKKLVPEKLEEAVNSMGEKTVFLPIEAVQTYYQGAGLDVEQSVFDLTGSETAYEEAVATGGEIAIPLGRYASRIGADAHKVLGESARLKAGQSVKPNTEMPEFNEEDIQAAMKEAYADPKRLDDASGEVYDAIYGQLVDNTDRAAANQYAAVTAAVYGQLAKRNNMTPMELYNQFKINIPGASQTKQTKAKVDATYDPVLDAIRARKWFSDKDIHGPSLVSSLIAAGGIKPDSVGAAQLARMVDKGRVGLFNNNGMTLDAAVVWAKESGFAFDTSNEQAGLYDADAFDINALSDLIDRDIKRGVYAPENMNEKRASFNEAVDSMMEMLDAAGIDVNKMTNEEIKSLLMGDQQTFEQGNNQNQLVDESKIVNPIDPNASNAEKLSQIAELSAENKPIIDEFLKNVDAKLGTESKSSIKADENILTKSARPSIRIEKPWHDIEHVRDTLRFKVVVNQFSDLPKIAEMIAEQGWEVLKIDTGKLLNPKEWGWRFVALDLRMPNGQMVEFYAPSKSMEVAKKGANHKLFEKWRNKDLSTLNQTELDEYFDDLKSSNDSYNEAFQSDIADSSESELRASLSSFSAIAESLTRSNESLSSSAENLMTGNQVPSMRDAAGLPFSNTMTRLKSGVADTSNVSDSDIGVSSTPILSKNGSDVKQAKSATGNNGDSSESDNRILYQDAGEKDLIVTHNISESGLLHANKMGGLAVPSLAVTKADSPLEGFGEITLIGESHLADPKRGAKAFGADVYSPRYPTINYSLDKFALKRLNALFEPYMDGGRPVYGSQINSIDDLTQLDYFKKYMNAKYGDEHHNWHDVKREAESVLSNIGADEKLFKGYTNNGRRYAPHTLENVVKMLKKDMVGSESTSLYGVGALRSKFTPKFKSISQIKSNKDRLISKEEFEKVKEDINTEFFEVVDQLREVSSRGNSFSFTDTVMAVMEDSIRMGIPRALKEYDIENAPPEAMKSMADFMGKLKTLPTEYFEVLQPRAVGLYEFHTAIVPSNVKPETIKILEQRGLNVKTYDADNDASRRDVIKASAEEARLLFQPDGGSARGSVNVRKQADGTIEFDIHLFKKANFSTFLHESGHAYLEIMQALAKREGAPADIVADWQKIKDYLGVKGDAELTVEQHEKFARSFEAYSREGKAPSSALKRAFASFKIWLTRIYKTATALDVELSDDIRGVMDRMLASEAEIQDAQKAQNLGALFKDRLAEDWDQDTFDAYVKQVQAVQAEVENEVAAQLLKAEQDAQAAWYKTELKQMQDDVALELSREPVYVAQQIMRTNKYGNGDASPFGEPIHLDKADLLDMYGSEYLKRMKGLYRIEGGISANEAAVLFGFPNGTALVEALVNAESFNTVVKAEAQARMDVKYPDPMKDGSLPQIAMNAVHSDKMADVLVKEINMLEKRSGKKPTVLSVMKEAARRMVAEKPLRSIRSDQYLHAEQKAGREAIEAAAKQDWEAARVARRMQLLNHQLFKASQDAKTLAAKQHKYLRRFIDGDKRAQIGKLSEEHLNAIDAMLAGVDWRKGANKDTGRGKSWRDLTLNELNAIHDAVKEAYHGATIEGLLRSGDTVIEKALVSEAMAKSVADAHGVKPPIYGLPSASEKVSKEWKIVRALAGAASDLAREMDGYKDGGAVWNHTVRIIHEAMNNRVLPALQKAQEREAEIYLKHYTKKELRSLSRTGRQFAGVPGQWSKEQILVLGLNWGNEGNREAIQTQVKKPLTQPQIAKLLGSLDSRDWAFIQDVWEMIDSYWGEISDVAQKRKGLRPAKVEGAPFTIRTSDGKVLELKGGYYPLKGDADSAKTSAESVDDYYEAIRTGAFSKASTKDGHTIERVGFGGRTVRLDLGVISQHQRDVLRDIHLGDSVNYVHQALSDYGFINAVEDAGMLDNQKALKVWLKDVAAGELGLTGNIEKSVRALRTNYTASVLTYKVVSAALQITGVIQSSVVVGHKNMLWAAKQYSKNPNAAGRHVDESSNFMKFRAQTQIDAVEQMVNAQSSAYASGKASMIKFGYYMIGRVQRIVDVNTWLAAEKKGIEMFGADQSKVIAYADDVVKRSQGSGAFEDKTSIQRGTFGEKARQLEFIKASTMLMGYMIAKNNVLIEQANKASKTNVFPASIKMATVMAELFVIETLIVAAIRGQLPDDEDGDGLMDDLLAFSAKEGFYGLFGGIPVVSQIASENRGFDAKSVSENFGETLKKASDQINQGELDYALVKSLSSVAGATTGAPSAQFNKTMQALEANENGEDVALHEYLTGLRK